MGVHFFAHLDVPPLIDEQVGTLQVPVNNGRAVFMQVHHAQCHLERLQERGGMCIPCGPSGWRCHTPSRRACWTAATAACAPAMLLHAVLPQLPHHLQPPRPRQLPLHLRHSSRCQEQVVQRAAQAVLAEEAGRPVAHPHEALCIVAQHQGVGSGAQGWQANCSEQAGRCPRSMWEHLRCGTHKHIWVAQG